MTTVESTNKLRILFALVAVMMVAGVALPTTYTVTNTSDSEPGSLREAIESANANPGQDLIAFNIPGPGPHTIQPELLPLMPWETYPILALPMITDPVIIDGYTQPGAYPATESRPAKLLIEIDGINAIDEYWVNGLSIAAGNCTIRGLVINRFGDCGIRIHENGSNIIQGNYLGTDVTGTQSRPNHDSGVAVGTSGNMIGGTTPEERNVLSGNGASGVQIYGGTGNVATGNYIGTDATATADLGNGWDGVHIGSNSSDARIGPGNVISGNDSRSGIEILGNGATTNHRIVGNLVGTDVSGTNALGNEFGIRLMDCSGNTVEDNIVSNSRVSGISISCDPALFSVQDNTVTGNTVCSNAVFGIQIEFADDNTIYNNSFINNGYMNGNLQVVDHAGVGNRFNLDKPLGGNYWSDWTGPDDNGDGFVDEPYVIWTPEGPYGEYGNQDNLPWASQNSWSNGCLIKQIIAQVEALDLPKGTENSLKAKLDNAAKKLGEQNINAAINSLNAFINEVEAQRGKQIPIADADDLIDATQAIIDLLESM